MSKSVAVVFLLGVQTDLYLEGEAPAGGSSEPSTWPDCLKRLWFSGSTSFSIFIYSLCAFSAPDVELLPGALVSFGEEQREAPGSGLARGCGILWLPGCFCGQS